MKISGFSIASGVVLLALAGMTRAQFGGPPTQEWSTSGADAQRSHWIRKDTLISKAAMSTGKFGFLWKLQVNSRPRGLNVFSRPVLVTNAMGYKGFRSLLVLAGPSNTIFAVDNDFGRMEWEKHFDVATPAESTAPCPGGMTAAATRAMSSDPSGLANRASGVRGFRSALSEPGAGASVDSVTSLPEGRVAGQANAAGRARAGGRGRGSPLATGFLIGAQPIMALASDGVLHFLSPITTKELLKPLQFIPANAHATDLAAVNGVIYTATVNGCGGVPNALWAIDPGGENQQARSWKTNGGSVVGTMAFGGDGAVYAAIGEGRAAEGGYSDSIVALDPATLKIKGWFTQPGADFKSTPVVFRSKGKELLAEASGDGRLFLLDTASLGGADHHTPLQVTPPSSGSRTSVVPDGLASWTDENGVQWLLAPSGSPPLSAGFKTTNGAVANGAIVAWKMAAGPKASLEPAWVSRDMIAPLPPIVVNGVIFAVASGEYHPGDAAIGNSERTARSSPAVLYALDATTGKEIWNSGMTMTSFAHGTGLSSSPGQVYLATSDGIVYAFGMPWERQ
jgi:outer membrane protein assembly factor BamB